ncbi:amino acid permease [Erythrobacter sp. 3-20A1M]|uniref:APC family permease n=1 Tax=Erythrobacter sp. 3-20A1M TaxID=2653850 RepID=UPI001BFCCE4A|nr:APC family permease [Erythrobacter sp. 3-20A1M]QWC55826.1 amino acid permease [Erythrobacter sp. 3-20A1M]
MSESRSSDRIGPAAVWAIAVGGMVGGGIFSTLGVVISSAGQWAGVSFVLGGLVALATGHSLSALTVDSDEAGGIYSFLRDLGRKRIAAASAWVLLAGYVLTCAVYAYTFGAYIAHAVGGPGWIAPAMASAAIVSMAAINLRGAGQATGVEIAIVAVKLAILAALAAFGLSKFDASALTIPSQPGLVGIVVGAASVFMAYEGFELLAYDYDEMRDRKRTITRMMALSIVSAAAIYVLVALAVPMLTGTQAVMQDGEVALSNAGQAALGTAGLIAVTIAAALSTASAINATIFSSARLAEEVAKDGALPGWLDNRNGHGAPQWAVLSLSALALGLAIVGGLGGLVSGASLVFLLVFGTVNALAFAEKVGRRWVSLPGAIGAFSAMAVLVLHFAGVA